MSIENALIKLNQEKRLARAAKADFEKWEDEHPEKVVRHFELLGELVREQDPERLEDIIGELNCITEEEFDNGREIYDQLDSNVLTHERNISYLLALQGGSRVKDIE